MEGGSSLFNPGFLGGNFLWWFNSGWQNDANVARCTDGVGSNCRRGDYSCSSSAGTEENFLVYKKQV